MEDEDEKVIPNSKKAYDFLLDKGIPQHTAAGLVGNLMQESYQLNKTWASGNVDNKGSMGIMQWHGSRLNSLYEFQKKKDPNYTNGKPISLTDQLEFILYEAETGAGDPWMQKQYSKAFEAKTAEEAAAAFSKHVFRPNSRYAHNDKRISYASSFGVTTGENNSLSTPDNQEFNPYTQPETYSATIDNVDNQIDSPQRYGLMKQMDLMKNASPQQDDSPLIGSGLVDSTQLPVEQGLPQEEVGPVQEQEVPTEQPRQSYTSFIEEYLKGMREKETNENAYGGPVNSYNIGGAMYNEFNNGGTHEENPNGGIPQGMGSNGKLNTVEEGETSFDFEDGKYIFSNRLKL